MKDRLARAARDRLLREISVTHVKRAENGYYAN
jgi:hypothetical protein